MSESRPGGNTIFRHLRWQAILAGFAVDFGSSILFGIMVGMVAGFMIAVRKGDASGLHGMMHEPRTLLISGAFGSLFTVLGGVVAGCLATRARYRNAGVVALLDIAVGIPSYGSHPLWFNALAIGVTLPCALLGAYLAGFIVRARQPPPLPPALPPQG